MLHVIKHTFRSTYAPHYTHTHTHARTHTHSVLFSLMYYMKLKHGANSQFFVANTTISWGRVWQKTNMDSRRYLRAGIQL